MGATTPWVVGSSTYTAEALHKVYVLVKVAYLRKDTLPSIPGDHPELYLSPLLGE